MIQNVDVSSKKRTNMKNLFLLFLLIFSTTVIDAQHRTDPAVSAEIDEQVWKPFRTAYNSYDAEVYNNLHTNDVLRVTSWGIKLGEVYKKSIIERYGRPDNPKREIDFRFQHRIHEGDVGYEVGLYKVVTQKSDGTERVSVGRFHVVLKKINGTWKIAQDWDESTINGVAITVTDFDRLSQ